MLIVDEAHDLRQDMLTSLKRLIETTADGEGKLSVLLAGHPKLRQNLRSPRMEEIGYRTTVFSLEGVTSSQREYIKWTLATCAADGVQVDDMLDPAAVDLLAARLRTPLQIEQHLTLALETGYQASEKPVGEGIVDSVLSKQIDDLEPTLTRHGYTAKGAGRAAGHQAWRGQGLVQADPWGRALARAEGADARRRAASVTHGPGTGCLPIQAGPFPSPFQDAISVGRRLKGGRPLAWFLKGWLEELPFRLPAALNK